MISQYGDDGFLLSDFHGLKGTDRCDLVVGVFRQIEETIEFRVVPQERTGGAIHVKEDPMAMAIHAGQQFARRQVVLVRVGDEHVKREPGPHPQERQVQAQAVRGVYKILTVNQRRRAGHDVALLPGLRASSARAERRRPHLARAGSQEEYFHVVSRL